MAQYPDDNNQTDIYPKVTHIHQILFLENAEIPTPLPVSIQRNQDAVRSIYPEAEYHLWSLGEMRDCIRHNMPEYVLESFDTLKPMAYKADLGRLILLYIYGGLYIDLGVIVQNRWVFPSHKKIAACRDAIFVTQNWTSIQNGLLWAEPSRPELHNAIERIYENCKQRFYGANPLFPTGPVLLGKAFASVAVDEFESEKNHEQDIGSCLWLNPEGAMSNLSYISKQGTIIALRSKKIGGDLSHLGIKHGNNYNEIWETRSAYNEPAYSKVIQKWSAASLPLRSLGTAKQITDGITITAPMRGRLNCGPYITLPAGNYCLEAFFTKDSKFLWVVLEISCGFKNKTIYRKYRFFWSRKKKKHSIRFPFRLNSLSDNLEFRIYVHKNFSGTLSKFHLENSSL